MILPQSLVFALLSVSSIWSSRRNVFWEGVCKRGSSSVCGEEASLKEARVRVRDCLL